VVAESLRQNSHWKLTFNSGLDRTPLTAERIKENTTPKPCFTRLRARVTPRINTNHSK